MLQCLGAEEEKKLLWLFELRNFFLSFSSKFRAKNFSYIVQRRCRNSKSKRRGFLFNFCFPVFVFYCFLFFSVSSSAWKISDPCALEPHKKIRETIKPFFYNCKGGRAWINLFFSKSGVAARVSVMTSVTTFDVFLIRANR